MASVQKRETSRGVRYDVRYRDPTGRARVKTWRRRADAERFARRVETDKDRGLFVDPRLARTPVADIAAMWLGSNPGKRDGSWQRDEIAVRRYIVPALGDRPIGGLTREDVQSVVNRWAKERAPRTVRREYGTLRAIVNYALVNDFIARSPCRGIKLPEVVRSHRRIVDAAELARLAKSMGGVGRYGPMAYLGAVVGLRWGEVAALRVRHVDPAVRSLAVVETVVRGRGGKVGFGAPKSDAGRRTLALPVELVDMLEAHMAEKALTAADGDALLFTAPDGGVLRYSNWLRRVWWPACVSAGLGGMVEDEASGRSKYQGLGFHDLRRANATGLVVEGVDVKTAQGLLGHSTPQLTLDLYAQQVNFAMVMAANAMGARFLGQSPRDGRAMESGESEGPEGE